MFVTQYTRRLPADYDMGAHPKARGRTRPYWRATATVFWR